MANITRANIRDRIYQFLPQVNQSAKLTLVNDSIDIALEEISHRHDFVCLRGTNVATATVTSSQTSLLESNLGPSVYSTASMAPGVDWIKDVINLWLYDTSGNTVKFVKFLELKEFDRTYTVESVSNKTAGCPGHYTKLGNLYLFNCPTDKAYKALVRYQMYHPRFGIWSTCTTTTTTTSGTSTATFDPSTATIWFDAKNQMAALNAIVYTALRELKASLNSVEFPQELQAVDQLAERWTQKLIERDKMMLNEDWELGWAERADDIDQLDPYYWLSSS